MMTCWSSLAFGSRTSYHLANPFGWAHMMPTGETPGWSQDYWINFELSQSNLWNSETTRLTNKRNGETITFLADYEQTSAILEMGAALSKRWAMSLMVPYAHRGGGFLDGFIDDFHVFIGSDRFSRHFFDQDRSVYRVENGDEVRVAHTSGGDVGNLKFKLKYWMWQWNSPTKGACDCGLSFGLHAKAPLGSRQKGFTSGEWDFSGTVHLGLPINSDSGFFATSAVTYTNSNDFTSDWPARRWHQMYEASFDFGLGGGWGIVLIGRMESPWLDKGSVEFQTESEDRNFVIAERLASGWNGLVHWRGSQSGGIRYRDGSDFQIGFHVIEDWALGNYDESGDDLYVNNAPDVAFVLKLHSSF